MSTAILPSRSEIAVEHTWNLESMYESNALWEKDFEDIGEKLPAMQAYQGQLGQSAKLLLGALRMSDGLGQAFEKLYSYAHMRKDENNTNSIYQALVDRALSLRSQLAEAMSFISPEIIAISDDKLAEFMQAAPDLVLYKHMLEQIAREKKHIRSAEIEAVVALSLEMASSPDQIYSMLTDADLSFPSVQDQDGNTVQITKGRFTELLESPDRQLRKAVYEAFYDTFAKYSNTIGSTYAASVKKDIFYARVHNYSSAVEASLSPNNIPIEVYDNLVETVNQNLAVLHRYMKLRKRVLGVEELHMYDLYTPLVPQAKKKIPYAESVETVLKSFSLLGEDYVKEVNRGVNSRWIDVYENAGKTSGAYSFGSYSSQPFILLNYQDNLDSLYTLAHELGHSLHSHYTNQTQPYVYAGYSLFVAEVASITNEAILTHHLLSQELDKETRTYIVNAELEKYRSTLYRQTLFAEFERDVYRKAENGEALTPDLLNEMYLTLVKRYYGPEMHADERISREWMRIPHFYNAFYVYQYATGLSAAATLSQQMINEGKPAVDRYREFLTLGSSAYPTDLLAKAGVDMTSPAPVQQAINNFERLLDEFEKLIA